MELEYINYGNTPIKIKAMYLNPGKDEYRQINNTCSNGSGVILRARSGCKITVQIYPDKIKPLLSNTGDYKFKYGLPKFDIAILDERGNIIDEYSDVQPKRNFVERDDAENIWVQLEHLVVKFERYLDVYSQEKQKVLRAVIDYDGAFSTSYENSITTTSLLKLSDSFKVLNDGGIGCTYKEEEKYINFICPIVVRDVVRKTYSIPHRTVEVEFNNATEHLRNANSNLTGEKIIGRVVSGSNSLISDENEEILTKFKEKSNKRMVIKNFWSILYRFPDNSFSFNLNFLKLERKLIKEYLNEESKCIGKSLCTTRIPSEYFAPNALEKFYTALRIKDDETINNSRVNDKYHLIQAHIWFTCVATDNDKAIRGGLLDTLRSIMRSEILLFQCPDPIP